ncbi:TIGR02117 family protein [Rhizobium sp. BK376]|uniref:TIGR02117 family protein n=1 Tax=Rhizobium sp. BK376 TaxID=2512149 RepID=UPI0010502676|nr:TIGR02117 family protein [Rhizobium sp. BK376]TCR91880.1 uncharacterized protein (TIGR02117 family) [Rhizobium sp. BK376]
MMTTIRWLLRAALLFVCAVTIGVFVPRPFFKTDSANAAADKQLEILVLSGAIHTDIAVPINDEVRKSFSFLVKEGFPLADPNARWLVLGWGGRSFYLETPTWADLRPMPVLRAFTLDRSVMHVEIAGDISDKIPGVTPVAIDGREFQHLLDFVSDSFVKQSSAVLPIPDAAYGQSDRFFEAKGYFNALFGCNTWAAGALRAAGLRTGLWNPLPQTLQLSLALYN